MTIYRERLVLVCSSVLLMFMGACTSDVASQATSGEGDFPALPSSDLYAGSPYLGSLRNSLVYGEIWERPQLSKRDRSLITIAVLQALTREELAIHIPRGLDNGLSPEEISEIILHVTFYAGWPAAVNAGTLATEAFEARGIDFSELR